MQKLRPDMDIGKNLQSIRKSRQLSQAQVAEQMQIMGCEISRITYSKMERNVYNIRISELVALKIIYNVDFSEFFAGLVPDEYL